MPWHVNGNHKNKNVITLYSHLGGALTCDFSEPLSELHDRNNGHRHRASLQYVCACGSSNLLDKLYHMGRQGTCTSSYGWPHLAWPLCSSYLSLHVLCPAPPVEDAYFIVISYRLMNSSCVPLLSLEGSLHCS